MAISTCSLVTGKRLQVYMCYKTDDTNTCNLMIIFRVLLRVSWVVDSQVHILNKPLFAIKVNLVQHFRFTLSWVMVNIHSLSGGKRRLSGDWGWPPQTIVGRTLNLPPTKTHTKSSSHSWAIRYTCLWGTLRREGGERKKQIDRQKEGNATQTSLVSSKSHLFPAIASTMFAGPNLFSSVIHSCSTSNVASFVMS